MDANITGAAGELFVCFDFARRGYRAVNNLFQAAPYDVLVDLGGGELLKVEVKTAGRARPHVSRRTGRGMESRYCYYTEGMARNVSAFDIAAFVALDMPAAIYLPASDPRLLNGAGISFPVSDFNQRGVLDDLLLARFLC